MDFRQAFRPYGNENTRPALHQRHKSTGNLASKANNTSIFGLRGNTKRAAFEDVTNQSKHNVDQKDGGKLHKVQSAWPLAARPHSSLGKENASMPKDVQPLARPARKLPVVGNKAVFRDARPGEAERPVSSHANIASQRPQSVALTSVPEGSLASAPLQPRHYKSQPQLKQPQPTLRRTQSRQLDKAQSHGAEPRIESFEPIVLSDIPQSDPVENYDTLDLSHYESLIENVIYEEPQAELPTRLPGISEEPAATVNFQDGPATRISEPEEYWEGEDDDYDDQGYTTAHSFKSRDMTTGVTAVLQPKFTDRVERELDDAAIEVAATRLQEDVDEEFWDVSMVAEYSDEIFGYLREMEIKLLPSPHYMETQAEIKWSSRAILMEWLVQVHGRFSLLPETLFLTVNYVDRFLTHKVVSLAKLQLVGATALLVASKYEEIHCPSLQEIVFMVDGGYSAEEILKAERFMLSMLSFELGWPGPMSFLRLVSKADDYDLDTRTLAKYFLELTIMDERFVASPPSFLAAGAHCLSRFILNKGHWTKHHVHYSGYTWNQLKHLVTMMIECCENPEEHHQAVFDKYAEKKFKEASILVQRTLDNGFMLPHQNHPVRPRAQPVYHEEPSHHYISQLLPIHA